MLHHKTQSVGLKIDALLLVVVALIAWGVHLQRDPVLVAATNLEAVGTFPPPSPPVSDTLLVVDAMTIDRPPAASFNALDFGLGWFNILSQEQGSFMVADRTELSAARLTGIRLVVMATHAARALPPALIEVVKEWVRGGGLLLLEQPGPAWNPVTHLGVRDVKPRPTRRVTAADSSPLRGSLRDALLGVPILSTMVDLEVPGGPAETSNDVILEVDGRPAMVHTALGAGHVYTLAFDLARAVMTLQQGRPHSDFTVLASEAPAEGDDPHGGLVQPSALVADAKLLGATVPYADLLEQNTISAMSLHVPLPKIWYFPGVYAGALIMSHDEDAAGDPMTFLEQWETEHGLETTTFATPASLSDAKIAQLLSDGHDVQLQWSRSPEGPAISSMGLGPWRPFARDRSLTVQKRIVEEQLSVQLATINRNRDGLIDRDWSSTFRKLAAVHMVADCTYGPSASEPPGYLFATGMPFYPLDHNGLLLPVAEIPTLMRSDGAFDLKKLRQLLTQSEAGYHQIVQTNVRLSTMVKDPSVDALRTWRASFGSARSHHHWVTNVRDYVLFAAARSHSTLVSRFHPSERRLEITATIVQPTAHHTERTAEQALPGSPSVAFPQSFHGSSVETVSLDGKSVKLKKMGRSGDGFFHILETPSGRHTIHVTYGGSVLDPQ